MMRKVEKTVRKCDAEECEYHDPHGWMCVLVDRELPNEDEATEEELEAEDWFPAWCPLEIKPEPVKVGMTDEEEMRFLNLQHEVCDLAVQVDQIFGPITEKLKNRFGASVYVQLGLLLMEALEPGAVKFERLLDVNSGMLKEKQEALDGLKRDYSNRLRSLENRIGRMEDKVAGKPRWEDKEGEEDD